MGDALTLLSLTPVQAAALAAIVLIAGIVRGFSGFALSAVVMASAIIFLPVVELIPILWFQELTASLVMARGGVKDSNKMQAGLLVIGAWIGWPIGLSLTFMLPVEHSKLAALTVILCLAVMQLANLRIPGLASTIGTFVSGIVSGIVSGVAHVGGMVVALYVLSQGTAARSMRGTLVLYLFLSTLGSFFIQRYFGVMTEIAMMRGLALLPVTILGVWLGTKLFSPRWEPYYRPFCLGLLIVLAALGLIRTGLGL